MAAMAIMIGVAAAPQRAAALHQYELVVTCPIDGQDFLARMIAVYRQTGVRLDTMPIGDLIAPYPFPVCPGNGFVMYKTEFTDSEIGQLKLIVATDEYKSLRSAHTDYYMIAYFKTRLGEADNHDLGDTYLRASWEAERDKPKLVASYRTLALKHFDAFLTSEPNHTEKWWTAAIVAAELDRLLGNFDSVEQRFRKMPLSELEEAFPGTGLVDAANQVRMHALRHNARPEMLQFESRQALYPGCLPQPDLVRMLRPYCIPEATVVLKAD